MHPERFLTDLEAKPAALRTLADVLAQPGGVGWPSVPAGGRVLLAGMGSSWFAAVVAARGLRRAGVTAVAELASAEASWPVTPDLTVVVISASGGSAETLDFASRYSEAPRLIALTNTPTSPICALATATVDMRAGEESSGVACRSELHTLVALASLEEQVTGVTLALPDACRQAARAITALLDERERWLDAAAERLAGAHGTWLLAPAERIASALQGALMVREVPRRQADGCETGDWSHVDVYLTKTLDYRALVFAGSRFDGEAARWMTERGATVVSVHPEGAASFPNATLAVTYPTGGHPLVPLLVETTVAELVAEHWWRTAQR